MDITEAEAKSWFESNGISGDDWDELPGFQKGMIGIESVAFDWDDVHSIRETGIPESAAVLYFHVGEAGLDEDEVLFEDADGDLGLYVMQNTTSENMQSLFSDDSVSVVGVRQLEGSNDERYVLLECEADMSLFD